jgi:hypothetical protein
MVILLFFHGSSDALNELGDQIGELLLAARGKLVPDRWWNGWNLVWLIGCSQLAAAHAFPPLSA